MTWAHSKAALAATFLIIFAGSGCIQRTFVASFKNINAPLLLNQHPTHLAGEASTVEWRKIGKLDAMVERETDTKTTHVGGAYISGAGGGPGYYSPGVSVADTTGRVTDRAEMEASRALGGRIDRVVVGLEYILGARQENYLTSETRRRHGIRITGDAMEPARGSHR